MLSLLMCVVLLDVYVQNPDMTVTHSAQYDIDADDDLMCGFESLDFESEEWKKITKDLE